MDDALFEKLPVVGKKRKALKLFVWKGFSPDYTDGLAFAIARDEAEARAMVEKEIGGSCASREWGTLTVYQVSRKYAAYVCGGS